MQSENNNPTLIKDLNLVGIKGWLAFLGISIVLNPILLLLSTIGIFNSIFIQNSLTTIFEYKISIGIIVIFELCFSLSLFTLSLYTLILFFKRKKLFPKYQIIFFISYFSFSIIDYISVLLVYGSTQLEEQIIRTFLTSIIWVAYLVKSVRVKNTFIN